MYHFNCYRPETLQEASRLLMCYEGNAALLAGGTALLIDMHLGKCKPEHMVALWNIAELGAISTTGDTDCRLGALTTITEIANSFKAHPMLSGLYDTAIQFGSRQIQNVATVGGNLCKASPAADMTVMLLSLGAKVHLEGPNGQCEMLLEDFVLGPGKTAIQPAQILTQVSFSHPGQRTGTAFLKNIRRKAVDLAIVSVGSCVTLGEDGETVTAVRISLGAVAPTPFRARKAEAILKGQKLSDELIHQAAYEACQEARPIDDIRASAEYRRTLVETLVHRAVVKAAKCCVIGGRPS